MGGRGTSSSKINVFGRADNIKGSTDEADILRSVAGEKGSPMSAKEAAEGSNPDYDKDPSFRDNCKYCIIAYEARRRGFDVKAKPSNANTNNFLWYAAFGANSSDLTKIQGTSEIERYSNILDEMLSYGNGSRAVVRVGWKNNLYGHVFIAEQHNGQTYFIDPQTGKAANGKVYLQASTDEVYILRIDNRKLYRTPMRIAVERSYGDGK